jgi:Fe-S-cluster containining protein
VATGIDTPSCKRDYDNIRWYLMHENVQVFIDKDGEWTLEFITPCAALLHDNTCGRYSRHPRVCREYPSAESWCEYEDDDLPYSKLFTCVEDFERYLDGKKIDWRWKRRNGQDG